jgi:hypothetical protein
MDTALANKENTNDTTSKIAGKKLPAPQPTTVPKTKGKNAAMPTESQPPTATKTRAKPASMPIKDKDHKERPQRNEINGRSPPAAPRIIQASVRKPSSKTSSKRIRETQLSVDVSNGSDEDNDSNADQDSDADDIVDNLSDLDDAPQPNKQRIKGLSTPSTASQRSDDCVDAQFSTQSK